MNHTNSPESNPDETIVFKRSHLYAVLLPLAFVLGLSVGYLFWGRSPAGAPGAPNAAQANTGGETTGQEPQQVRRYSVPTDDDPATGPENAPITIIEFSDYECPYCTKWHTEVYPKILETYPEQVRFVYRDFPLQSIHPNAAPAAEAANCANEQGAFWEFHEMLFTGSELSPEIYSQYAQDLALDTAAFEECVSSRKYKGEVTGDFEYAANLGISSTPTFFINGIPLVGAQPFEVFQEVIDKELAGEIP